MKKLFMFVLLVLICGGLYSGIAWASDSVIIVDPTTSATPNTYDSTTYSLPGTTYTSAYPISVDPDATTESSDVTSTITEPTTYII